MKPTAKSVVRMLRKNRERMKMKKDATPVPKFPKHKTNQKREIKSTCQQMSGVCQDTSRPLADQATRTANISKN